MGRSLAVAALFFIAACALGSSDYLEGKKCDASHPCGEGYACVGGICRSSSGAGGGTGGGTAGVGGGANGGGVSTGGGGGGMSTGGGGVSTGGGGASTGGGGGASTGGGGASTGGGGASTGGGGATGGGATGGGATGGGATGGGATGGGATGGGAAGGAAGGTAGGSGGAGGGCTGVCTPNQMQACNTYGTRTCQSDCTYGACSCPLPPVCVPNSMVDCVACGKRTCDACGQLGPCANSGACDAGVTRMCGTAGNGGSQTCDSVCQWGPCQCAPGTTMQCTTGGSRVCSDAGTWCDCLSASCSGGGSFIGCRGTGCSVCDEMINRVTYPCYWFNHPTCAPNFTCQGSYFSCSTGCPAPTAADMGPCGVCGGSGGQWPGCRGNGCAVCGDATPSPLNYACYFINHPACQNNSSCLGVFGSCNNACPVPDAGDLGSAP